MGGVAGAWGRITAPDHGVRAVSLLCIKMDHGAGTMIRIVTINGGEPKVQSTAPLLKNQWDL